MPPMGGQFVTNCPSKRFRWGKNSRFSVKIRRESNNNKANKRGDAQNVGETSGGVWSKTAQKVPRNACFT